MSKEKLEPKGEWVKIKCSCGTGYAGEGYSAILDVWIPEGASIAERDELCQKEAEEWLFTECIDFNWKDADDEDSE